MGNDAKRQRRRHAQKARSAAHAQDIPPQGSAQPSQDIPPEGSAAPQGSAPPHEDIPPHEEMPPPPQGSGIPPGFEAVTFQFRRDHLLDDSIAAAASFRRRGMLTQARKWYEDALPMAERERGHDDTVTLNIVAALVQIFYEQGDREAAARLIIGRGIRAMS